MGQWICIITMAKFTTRLSSQLFRFHYSGTCVWPCLCATSMSMDEFGVMDAIFRIFSIFKTNKKERRRIHNLVTPLHQQINSKNLVRLLFSGSRQWTLTSKGHIKCKSWEQKRCNAPDHNSSGGNIFKTFPESRHTSAGRTTDLCELTRTRMRTMF